MRQFWLGMAVVFGAWLSSTPSEASLLLIEAHEVGADVVFTWSGTVNVAGLTQGSDSSHTAGINATAGSLQFGSGATDSYTGFDSVPGNFGSGGYFAATSSSGNTFALSQTTIYLPDGYTTGTLSGTMTFTGASFASLGLTPDLYVWTWGETEGRNAVSLEIISEVPEPAAALIWLAVGGTCAASRRRRPPL